MRVCSPLKETHDKAFLALRSENKGLIHRAEDAERRAERLVKSLEKDKHEAHQLRTQLAQARAEASDKSSRLAALEHLHEDRYGFLLLMSC